VTIAEVEQRKTYVYQQEIDDQLFGR